MRHIPFDPKRLRHWPSPEYEFVAALVAKQEAFEIRDRDFALRLGVSCPLWRQTRRGSVRLGLKLVSAGAELVSFEVTSAAHNSLLRRAKLRWNRAHNGDAA